MPDIADTLLQSAQLVTQTLQNQQQLDLQRQRFAADVAQAEQSLALKQQQLKLEEENAQLQRGLDTRRLDISERNAAVGEGNLDLARAGKALQDAETRARTAQLQALADKYRADANPDPLKTRERMAALAKLKADTRRVEQEIKQSEAPDPEKQARLAKLQAETAKINKELVVSGEGAGGLGTVGGRQAANMLGDFVQAEVNSRTKDLAAIAGEEPVARYGKFTDEQINVQIKSINDSLGGNSNLLVLAVKDPQSAAGQEVARLKAQRDALLSVQGARFQLRQQVLSGDRADILEDARQNLNAFVGNDAATAEKLGAASNAAAAAGAGTDPPPLDALNSALREGVGSVEVAQLDVSLSTDLSQPGSAETIAEVWDGLLRQTTDTADLNAALADLFAYARGMDPGFDHRKYMSVIREIARRRGITRNTSK